MNRRELVKALFAGTALAALPVGLQNACAERIKISITYDRSVWTHVLFIRRGDDMKMYLNGELVDIDQTSFKIVTKNNGLQFYDPTIRDVAVEVEGDTRGDFTLTAWIKKDVPVLRARPKIKYR